MHSHSLTEQYVQWQHEVREHHQLNLQGFSIILSDDTNKLFFLMSVQHKIANVAMSCGAVDSHILSQSETQSTCHGSTLDHILGLIGKKKIQCHWGHFTYIFIPQSIVIPFRTVSNLQGYDRKMTMHSWSDFFKQPHTHNTHNHNNITMFLFFSL